MANTHNPTPQRRRARPLNRITTNAAHTTTTDRGRPNQRTITHTPREAAQSEQMAGSSRTKGVDSSVRTMAYIASQSPKPAAADTAQPNLVGNRRGHISERPLSPRGQHSAFKKDTTLKRRRWPVRQADLGFPTGGGAARPKNTPPRRKWHPQVSP
jgi:hypothetical protein